MTPQTRSRGKPPASASAPESGSKPSKVFKSSAGPPKQMVFEARRKYVRPPKTYSGRNRKVLKDSQQTLTQMTGQKLQSEVEEAQQLRESDEEDEDETENQAEGSEAPARKARAPEKKAQSKKRTRASRRKTTGDELVADEKPKATKRRKTLGDVPASATPDNHTITQYWRPEPDDDDEIWKIKDSEDEDDVGLVIETPKKPKDAASSKIDESKSGPQAEVRSSVPSLVPSATPVNRRTKTVIPSSTSPATPMLLRSYSPAPHKSPLTTKSTNLGAPSPIIKKVKTPKSRVVPNSWSTAHSLPTTPTPKATTSATQKKIRFEFPDETERVETESVTENKENVTPGRTKPKSPKPIKKTPARSPLKSLERTVREVADTDDENETIGDDDETVGDDDEEMVNEAAGVQDQNTPSHPRGDEIPSTEDPEPNEAYDNIGAETQAILNASADELSLELSTSNSRESSRSRQGTPTPRPKEKRREASRPTAVSSPIVSALNPAVEGSSISSPLVDASEEQNMAATHTQVYTQGMESQRLPMEVIRELGPQTQHSDILLSLHPEPLESILNRTKDHEFRSWRIPPGVSRVWIYGTKPIQELKYMFVVGDPKIPGQIEDENGIGNAEFNRGETAQFAYEILQVYELNNPTTLDEMKRKGWCKAAPQKFSWLPQAVVGELTANLKCALFGDEATESQEIMAQFQSDVEYSTQHQSSEDINETIPWSQSSRRSNDKGPRPKTSNSGFAKPAIPQPQPGSSVQSAPAAAPSQGTRGLVRPSQATTVSSPAVSPQKSLRIGNMSSDLPSDNPHSSSPAAFRYTRNDSIRSSQFLSRSQMLPDSLVNDEIQEPPLIVWDSADEQSD
ncbi:hypothetical protein GGR52DRAFT_554765 [Hypoxylon sp. FL1284]|nr:hypothetical protein GGR52DRAFT_554765 [Hypoxylon sp. FL1284]